MVVWIEIPVLPLPSPHPGMSPPAWWCGLKFKHLTSFPASVLVTTCVVVWIEIRSFRGVFYCHGVTTCVVVWIEISAGPGDHWKGIVTTCVVVWIEIRSGSRSSTGIHVTTCVVVWIEISVSGFIEIGISVTTCVVVWIEINFLMPDGKILLCHHLRGGVD